MLLLGTAVPAGNFVPGFDSCCGHGNPAAGVASNYSCCHPKGSAQRELIGGTPLVRAPVLIQGPLRHRKWL